MSIDAAQIEQLLAYLDLLARWNRVYNLTGIRDPAAMLDQHMVDCLSVVGPLRRELGGHSQPRILDVGSGGGLPGLVLAVMNPTYSVICVDAVGKKTAFIQQAATTLGLPNLTAIHSRVEQLVSLPFDAIVSRAFASLSVFTASTGRLLSDAGRWMAMKGKYPGEEIASLPREVEMFHVEQLDVPVQLGERWLVWCRPASAGQDSQ